MRSLPQNDQAGDETCAELETELARLKAITEQVTPPEVMESIQQAIAVTAMSAATYSVTVSCHGSTDAGSA